MGVYQGIYASPCDIRPNRDMVDTGKLAIKEQRLWVIEYTASLVGNGCAVVKAGNPKEAETILRSEGMLNGTSHSYRIIRIEEIIPSPDSMLLAEQIVTIEV